MCSRCGGTCTSTNRRWHHMTNKEWPSIRERQTCRIPWCRQSVSRWKRVRACRSPCRVVAQTCGWGWFNWCRYVHMKHNTIVGKALYRPIQPDATGGRKDSGGESALMFQNFRKWEATGKLAKRMARGRGGRIAEVHLWTPPAMALYM